MKIVIHSGAAWGGIVDYMIWQANAFVASGHEVILLVPENFEKSVCEEIKIRKILPNVEDSSSSPKIVRRTRWIFRTLKSWRIAAHETARLEPDVLLLSAFVEYLAPFWIHRFINLQKEMPELKIGAVVHDPVRLAFGPEKFHRLSVRRVYEMLDFAFVHNPVPLDQAGADPPAPVEQIPFGVYDFPHSRRSPRETRKRLNISDEQTMLFAFGHVRDGKNLDLAIQILTDFPHLHLVIAGKVISSRDRPISDYKNLAIKIGVENRVTILERFIPDDEVADLFASTDFVLLSYDGGFTSASSVLHVALKFRKPALATSGDGHLKWAVEEYELGVWAEPDSTETLSAGLRKLLETRSEIQPRWEDYERENTWEENARRVVAAFQSDTVKSISEECFVDKDRVI